MSIPTPYLDWVILASATYPSGFSHSLFTAWRGPQREVSTGLLGILVLPFVGVIPAVWALRPGLLTMRAATTPRLALAVLLVPVALLIEYGIHALESYRLSGRFPRGLAVQRFWRRRLSIADHILLGLVAAGEEIFYRLIWLGILLYYGVTPPLALGISSVTYGLNHLAFGTTAVFSKTATGLLYGGLYLFGGQSIWLPTVTHCLQNIALFQLTKE
jgi:Type II CAAX prenyl endopeptidase Rce1-like